MAVAIRIRNRGVDPVGGRWAVDLPAGFAVAGDVPSAEFALDGLGETRIGLHIVARRARDIGISNRLWLGLDLHRRPAVEAIPIVLMGARRWLVSRAVAGENLESDDAFVAGLALEKPAGGSPWRTASWSGNELLVEPHFKRKPGILFLRHFVRSPEARKVILGVPTNARMKLWLNGLLVKTNETPIAFRPNLTGDGANYVTSDLPGGWSQIVIKLERGREPIEAHFTVACDEPFFHGMDDLEQTRFPWETA